MKRDARIGLAVILVLGLAVTLLVTHSLSQRARNLDGAGDEAAAPAGTAEPTVSLQGTNGPEPTVANLPPDATHERALADFSATHAVSGPMAAAAQSAPTGNALPKAEVVDFPAGQAVAGAPGSAKNSGAALPPLGALAGSAAFPAPAADAGPKTYTYTIAAGDNPYKISAKVFGEGKYARKIMDANPGVDAAKLKVGQQLKIPAQPGLALKVNLPESGGAGAALPPPPVASEYPEIPGPALANATAPAQSSQTYVVKAGDTLSSIAKARLGSAGPKTLQKLLEANPGLDPKKVRTGMSLKLPAAAQ